MPNPFNPETNIEFSLESLSSVDLAIYNLRGEMVAQVAKGVYPAGSHAIAFRGDALSSGVYIYRLQANGKSLQRKMVLMK